MPDTTNPDTPITPETTGPAETPIEIPLSPEPIQPRMNAEIVGLFDGPEPKPFTHYRYTVRLADIINGTAISILGHIPDADSDLVSQIVAISMDEEGNVNFDIPRAEPETPFISMYTGCMTRQVTLDTKPSTRPPSKYRHLAQRILNYYRDQITLWNKMRDTRVLHLTQRRGTPPPQAVLDAAAALSFYAIESLEWAGDHYFVMVGNMYVGIEDNGYTHT